MLAVSRTSLTPQLEQDEQTERFAELAQRALAEWGFEDASLEPIKVRENAVFRADRPDGSRYAVRVHRAGYHSDAALASESTWTAALQEAGISTPDVVPARDGSNFKHARTPRVPEQRQVDVLAWIDGKPLGGIEDGVEGGPDELAATFETIGRIAATLHNQSESWQPPEGFTRHSWDLDGITGPDPLWGRFWECELLEPAQRELMLAGREALRADLEAFGTGPDRFGLIHADFVPEDFMVSDEGIRLIDFDDSGFGWHLFDLSTPLFFQLGQFGGPDFDSIRDAMLAGYRSERPLPDDHVAKLTTFLVARGTTYLGWVHTRREIKDVQAMAPLVVVGVTGLVEAYLAGT